MRPQFLQAYLFPSHSLPWSVTNIFPENRHGTDMSFIFSAFARRKKKKKKQNLKYKLHTKKN